MPQEQPVTNVFSFQKSLKKPSGSLNRWIKIVDLYLNRPMASLIVRLVFRTPVTPNGLTWFSFVLGMAGAASYCLADYHYLLLGGILVQASSVVDGADGMLARAKNMCSPYGAHLDLFFDRIIDFSVMAGITLGFFRNSHNPWHLIIGFLGAGFYLLQINLFYLTKDYLQSKESGETGEARAILYWLILILTCLNRLDFIIFGILIETFLVNTYRFNYFLRLSNKPRP